MPEPEEHKPAPAVVLLVPILGALAFLLGVWALLLMIFA